MGVPGSSSSSSSSLFLLVWVLEMTLLCSGSKTSSFIRAVEKGMDMALHSHVLQVPPGCHAPRAQYSIYSFLQVTGMT
ncbi:hypothetical protein Peur_035942 [Populus x canadensis]